MTLFRGSNSEKIYTLKQFREVSLQLRIEGAWVLTQASACWVFTRTVVAQFIGSDATIQGEVVLTTLNNQLT